MNSTWEGLLDSIFSGFRWVWVPNLGPSWEGKSSQDRTRQDKTGQDRTRQDKTRKRQDKTRLWQTKVPRGDLARGGAGFARLLGGYLPVDLEPSRLGSSAVQFSTSKRFFVVPVLGPFLDPFLFALPGLLGRSKIPLGRPPGNFVGILAPEWPPEWGPKWVPERFRCELQR